ANMALVADERSSGDAWRPGASTGPGATWNELAAQVYVGARDGTLSRDAAFELACFLSEWAVPHQVFDDLTEASLQVGDSDRLADLPELRHDAADAIDQVLGT